MKQDRVLEEANPQLSQSLHAVKGDLWNQQDIKKRHQRFIEEQKFKRSRHKIESKWNSYLNDDDIPQVRSPIANLNLGSLRSNNNTTIDFIQDISSPKNNEFRNGNKSFHFYTSRNNISYQQPSFLRKKKKQDMEIKQLTEAILQKDAIIRKLKKQNYNLKSQLKTQLNEIQNESQLKLDEQQKLIKALHQQLKQLMQPKGVAVEGRSFYAEQLERQMVSLEDRLNKAHSTNTELENIITVLYSQNNGGSFHLNNSFSGVRPSAKSKILQCLAILEDN